MSGSLLLAILLQVAPSPTADELEALTRAVLAAVEAGRDEDERARLNARLESDPQRAPIGLATLDRLTYRYEQAEAAYTALAAHSDANVRLYGRLGLALQLMQQGRTRDAWPVLHDVLAMADALHAPAARTHALTHLGVAGARVVGLDSALTLLRTAETAVPPGDEWLLWQPRCALLTIRVQTGDGGAAAEARRASRSALAAGNARAAASCLGAVAQDQERRGAVDSALVTFDEVAGLLAGTRTLTLLSSVRQWQGYTLASRAHYAAARVRLDEAIDLGRRTQWHSAVSWAELSLARMALSFGDLTSAGRHAHAASTGFTLMGDRWGLAQARMYEGDVALHNRSFAAARAHFDEALEIAPLVAPPMTAHLHGRLAAVATFEGDWTEADTQLERARTRATQFGITEWPRRDAYHRGLLALSRGQLDSAVAGFHALAASLSETDLAARAEVMTRLGEALARSGRIDEAERTLFAAADLMDGWRATLGERALRAAALESRTFDWDRDLGVATSLAALVRAGRTESAFVLSERRRARLLLEEVVKRRALGRDETNDDALARPPVVTRSADVVASLPAATALLAYVTGYGREPTTIFVISSAGLDAIEAPAVDDHARELERFAGLIAAGEVPRELAQRLGNAFIRDAIDRLPAGVTRLVVVGDGPLHRLPFDALMMRDGRLLVERFALALAPSVAVAAAWWSAPPAPPRPRLLAFGDPAGARLLTPAGDSMAPRLPAAGREVHAIARYAPQADVFTGTAARAALLWDGRLEHVGVLHFATHADIADWGVMRSALLLAPGDDDDGRLGAAELSALQLDGRLVVLAACRSGAGAVLTGEGLDGLTSPLLEAGAAAVVGTLWQIGDRSAAPFIALFYRELARGASVGDALHNAKLAAIAANMPPSVWAAFTLNGDARFATALRPPPRRWVYLFGGVPLLLMAGYLSRTRRRRNGERS